MLDGLQAWADRGLTPRTLILDDGWQDVAWMDLPADAPPVKPHNRNHGWLRSFGTNRETFPDGLAPLIREAKQRFGVEHFGVWHTLQGYWCGVDPDGPLADRYRIHRREARNLGIFVLPKVSARGAVDPDDAGRFFDDWHRELAEAGVDFVKVDNGGSTPEFCDAAEAVRYTHAYAAAVRASAGKHFGPGGLLPCMSMENAIAAAPDPGHAVHVYRNSDDFFPEIEHSHPAHARDNAAAALWTSAFAIPDWDMFFSVHPWAGFHAALRAISGGPVYVSDEVGDHDPQLIRRLVDGEARALRFAMPAEPVELSGARTLIRNRTRGAVQSTTLGLFRNAGTDARLAAADLAAHLPADAPVLRTDTGELVPPGGEVTAERCVLLTAAEPHAGGDVAVFGWSNALCPTLTVESVQPADGGGLRVTLRPPSDPDATVRYAVRDGDAWSLRHAEADGHQAVLVP